jgi:hypothetical protein
MPFPTRVISHVRVNAVSDTRDKPLRQLTFFFLLTLFFQELQLLELRFVANKVELVNATDAKNEMEARLNQARHDMRNQQQVG